VETTGSRNTWQMYCSDVVTVLKFMAGGYITESWATYHCEIQKSYLR
jgi:hypothetical protein